MEEKNEGGEFMMPIQDAKRPVLKQPCFCCEKQEAAPGELVCEECGEKNGLSSSHYYLKQYYYGD